jgi:threonyl-tRNA synthetase
MPAITLPDGSVRSFDGPVTGTTVAESIGAGLAKAALAMEVDGQLSDIRQTIKADAKAPLYYPKRTRNRSN